MKKSRKVKVKKGELDMVGRAAERRPLAALAVIAALLLGLGLLAGCGGGDDETTPPAETGTTTEPEETAPEETEPEGGEEGEEGEGGEGEAGGGTGGIQVSEGNAGAGKSIFTENCSVCHGSEGSGGNVGPSLQEPQLAQEEEAVVNQIVEGGDGMPPFGGQLSDQQIADVSAYVVEDLAKR